jgi:hypothetical protein
MRDPGALGRRVRVGIVCSAHGFGHVARQIAVAEALYARGAQVSFFTAAPAAVVHADLPDVTVVPWAVDVGIVQRDSLNEDVPATVAAVAERCAEARIDALAAALSGFDRVIVDVAPAGLEAARRAGRAPLAVGNFDWAWIYRHYPELRGWAEQFAEWQAPHAALALDPGPGMHGFASVEHVGLVGRRRDPARVAAENLDGRRVLVSFGGFGLDGVDALLPRIAGVTWVLAPPMPRLERPDCAWAPGVSFPALIAGVDAVLTKPGYGIHAESALAGTPVVWLDRGPFPEAPFLEVAMRARGDEKVSSSSGPASARDVRAAVLAVLSRPRPTPVASDGAARVADRVLR